MVKENEMQEPTLNRRSILSNLAGSATLVAGTSGLASATTTDRAKRREQIKTKFDDKELVESTFEEYADEFYDRLKTEADIEPAIDGKLSHSIRHSDVSVTALPVDGELVTHLQATVETDEGEFEIITQVEKEQTIATEIGDESETLVWSNSDGVTLGYGDGCDTRVTDHCCDCGGCDDPYWEDTRYEKRCCSSSCWWTTDGCCGKCENCPV